jgi:hypothetical protein
MAARAAASVGPTSFTESWWPPRASRSPVTTSCGDAADRVPTTASEATDDVRVYADCMRWCLLLLVGTVCTGCVTLTPDGSRVLVYSAALDSPPARRNMPDGCRLVATSPGVDLTELDMQGQKDPFRVQRNEAGAAGANALLVLSRMTVSRRDFECPGSSPITDCPPSAGAWYRVVFESYACTPDALARLTTQR